MVTYLMHLRLVLLSGELLTYEDAKEREKEYAKDPSIGSYMYFFEHRGRRYCIDGTEESPYKGRLINHSALNPNLKTKVMRSC